MSCVKRSDARLRTKPSFTPLTPREATPLGTDDLTESQIEFMEDLRVSLIQMKNGDVTPALEAMREIEREIAAEDTDSPAIQ